MKDNEELNADGKKTNKKSTYKRKYHLQQQKLRKGVGPLTPKQREFVRLMTSGTKITPTAAVMRVYNTDKPTTAGNISHHLQKNPKVVSALMAHAALAENTIVKAITDYGSSEKQWQRTLAVETSKWVHDKVHGKAIQQNINLNQNFTKHVEDKNKIYDI